MQPGELVAQRFEVEAPIGTGGMGAVYRARDRHTGQQVALKVLHGRGTRDLERFALESQLLAELGHPGIVRYVAHGRAADGDPYLAMEWLEGEDLADRLARRELTIDESLILVARAADALAAAHSRGVIHRDIKPANLFLPHGDIERVKLLDFGVARTGKTPFVTTRSGSVVGTPGYMSPEQARGDNDLDARTDVFALGCVLYECITGKPAFVGEHAMALLAKILLADPPQLREEHPEASPALEKLLNRMLAKERSERPGDGAVVSAWIAELRAGHERPPASVDGRPVALTGGEQRVLSVLLVGKESPSANESSAPTVALADQSEVRRQLEATGKAYGARLEWLADGSMVATLTGERDSATDLAARAARCALALRVAIAQVPMVLATGRGMVAGRWPVGDVLDRAGALLRVARAKDGDVGTSVVVDELTAGLLDARFEIRGPAPSLRLLRERQLDEARTLLGKATPFVGRERELSTLVSIYDECVAERVARVALVTAAAGVGKSRLRYELVRALAERPSRPQVWYARGDSLSAGSSFAMVAQMLRREVQIREGEPLPEQRDKLLARVARRAPPGSVTRVMEFLAEIIGANVDDAQASTQLRAARQDLVLLGDQMRRAFEDFVSAECRVQPLLILLEDLHWGDLPSVRLIGSVLRNLHDLPLMVLALARPTVHQLFPQLWAERDVTDIRLAGLPRRATEKLVRGVLDDPKLIDRALRLVERAGGNAFYVEELIRAVAEGKGDDLPPTVLAMVQGRLEAMDHGARRVLRAASVFGEVFWRGGVAALLGEAQRATRADDWLIELALREIVVARPEAKFPGETEYTFGNAIMREAAYAMLTDADRAIGHRLAAEWLVGAGEHDPRVLAAHFERGEQLTAAVAWYRRAAEQALFGGDARSAIPLAERGVACGATGEVLGALRLVQAEGQRWRGEFAPAESLGLEAREALSRPSPLWFSAQGELAVVAGRLGHVERVVSIGDELLAMPVKPELRSAHLGATARTAVQAVYLGRFDLADALLGWLRTQTPDLDRDDGVVAARVHQARGVRALADGDPATFLGEMTRAAERFERLGDLRNVCLQRANLGPGFAELGAYAEAELLLREAVATAERMELANVAIAARTNLAFALARRGDLDEARRTAEAAAHAAAAQGDRRMEGGARNFLAMILIEEGELEAATRHARAAVEILSVAPPLRAYALATLASARLRAGDAKEAVEVAREGEALLSSLSGTDEGESLVRLVFAEALWATGEQVAAREAMAKALGRVRARAERIGDAVLRESFLERVAENRRTRDLAREWGVG